MKPCYIEHVEERKIINLKKYFLSRLTINIRFIMMKATQKIGNSFQLKVLRGLSPLGLLLYLLGLLLLLL
jgi:hypothetical protein